MANPILEHLRLSGTTYDLVDSTAIHSLDGYWNSGQTQDAITAATNALAESISEMHFQTSGDVQNAISGKADTTAVTQAIDAATSGKADTTAVTQAISEAVSGKLDTSAFETYSGNVDTALASKIAGAAWDSQTSHLNFYDNVAATGSPLTYVDGADWIKDSFLKSVTIEDKEISGETVPCLVFVFETESGETETDIPLSDIFDPSNYVNMSTYTAYTAATDTVLGGKADTTAMTQAISEATSGKADTTAVTQINDALTAHTSNSDIHVTTSDKSTWSGKQDQLVSGTNIKTINGTSILGSGNLEVQTLPTVQGTTLIFS